MPGDEWRRWSTDCAASPTGCRSTRGRVRTLEVALAPTRVVVAGRGPGMLRAAGRVADAALLWAIPDSDLERSVGVITSAAAAAGRPAPELVWAPLLVRDERDRHRATTIAAYGILNASPAVRVGWQVSDALVHEVRHVSSPVARRPRPSWCPSACSPTSPCSIPILKR